MSKWKSLTIDEVIGQNQLDIFKEYGLTSRVTDFYILLDGFVLNNYHVFGSYTLENRTGQWMLQTSYNGDNFYFIDHRGFKDYSSKLNRQKAPRSVLLCDNSTYYSTFYQKSLSKIIEVCACEYPQTVVNEVEEIDLEKLYLSNKLNKTGRVYITDYPRMHTNSTGIFMPYEHIEYEYNGCKYIRFKTIDSYCNGNVLSDGRRISTNSVYWIKVEPVKFIVDLRNRVIIPKDLLLAGIQYDNSYYSNSDQIFMDNFMNTYFLPDLIKEEKTKQIVKKII